MPHFLIDHIGGFTDATLEKFRRFNDGGIYAAVAEGLGGYADRLADEVPDRLLGRRYIVRAADCFEAHYELVPGLDALAGPLVDLAFVFDGGGVDQGRVVHIGQFFGTDDTHTGTYRG